MSALPDLADLAARTGAWSARQVLGRLSPGGARGLSILIYHRVLAAPDPLFPGEVDRVAFARQMRWLKASYTVLPLLQAVRLARVGRLPPRAACITFDDGYADNVTVALPILRQLGLCATIFVASGFLDGGRMWNDSIIELVRRAPGPWFDAGPVVPAPASGPGPEPGPGLLPLTSVAQRRAAIAAIIGHLKYLPLEQRTLAVQRLVDGAALALPDDLMLRSDQVLAWRRAGMDIGAHTVRHPILAALDDAAARDEIVQGKQALESLLGAPVPLFAYPNGRPGTDYHAGHVALVRQAGFEGAVSTSPGAGPDLWQLPRFTPWDRRELRFHLRMARNLLAPCATA